MRDPVETGAGASDGARDGAGGAQGARPWRIRILRVAVLTIAAVLALLAAGWAWCVRMPGRSFAGPLPEPTALEIALAAQTEADVRRLCADFPSRNWTHPQAYDSAAAWVETRFRDAGFAGVTRHSFRARGIEVRNVEALLPGSDPRSGIVVVGAHYDAIPGTVGADDNASGVAALLALAQRMHATPTRRTVRFLAFANEEPPHFQSPDMGSLVYARACRERGDDVVAMLSLDGVGFYDEREHTQHYPSLLALAYPSRGDFLAFVGNPASRALVHRAIGTFRAHATLPSEGAVLPSDLTGVGWSDHWSFWQHGYAAIEVTDTLPFRYAHYHRESDVPDRLDFVRMARVVVGLEAVVRELADGP